MQTRRAFLKKAIALSGAAGFTGIIPDSIQRAFAIDPAPGTSYLDAEHVVILMQENRSFDHMLGTLQGVRGFNDPRALRLANGNPVWLQTNAAGETYAPFRLNIRETQATWMGSLSHARHTQIDAWNGGLYDRWLQAKQPSNPSFAHMPLTLGHYSREDIPFYFALADAFTVCDQHFCGAMTSTTPNRMIFWSGTVREQQNAKSRANLRNGDYRNGGAHWVTFPERLQQNGISWKFYQNDISATTQYGLSHEQDAWLSNFSDNPLEFFAQYNVQLSRGYLMSLPDQIARLSEEIRHLEEGKDGSSRSLRTLKRLQTSLEEKREQLKAYENDPKYFKKFPLSARMLQEAAFATNEDDPDYHDLVSLSYMEGDTKRELAVPKGDILGNFRKDVHSGKLPTVSWLAPPERFSDHPSSPWFGAWYVSEVMDILTKNPEVWKKTIFILTYDENDGSFDHIPPFVAPDPRDKTTGKVSSGLENDVEYAYKEDEIAQGISPAEARTGPVGLGYRVPMIVASPWSRGGWVNSQVFDHTSVSQFLEHFLHAKFGSGIREENISSWRRAISGDLTSVFRPFNGEKLPSLPFIERDPFIESIHKARFKKPPSDFCRLDADQIASINRNPLGAELLSHQETGIRPSCATPYELYVDGALSGNRSSFALRFHAGDKVFGERSAGAPFNVYLRGLRGAAKMHNASYAVAAGGSLQEEWPLEIFNDGTYHVAVHGPNGYMREFLGSRSDPVLRLSCEYETDAANASRLTGNIALRVDNIGSTACSIEIVDNAYGIKLQKVLLPAKDGHARIGIDLGKAHHWYDFSVTADSAPGFLRRYAGRVENGKPGYSDPLMGGVLDKERIRQTIKT